jgi:hypothetical protein
MLELNAYKAKLEHELAEYMALPVSTRSTEAVRAMVECWQQVDAMSRCLCGADEPLDRKQAMAWVVQMQNADGTTGAHWTIAEAAPLMAPRNITQEPETWWAVLNMMYSDYYPVAQRHGVNVPDFYADMAAAFLQDKDGPKNKAGLYYHAIFEHGKK